MKNTRMIGAAGELAVAKDLVKRGYYVFGEVLSDAAPVDIIAMKDGKLLRIQVKTTNAGKRQTVGLKLIATGPSGHGSRTRRYTSDEIDVFACYVLDRDLVLYVNSKATEIEGKNGLTIRLEPTVNNNTKKVNYYTKYTDVPVAQLDSAPDF